MMQYPALQPGDTIAVISPSGWVSEDGLKVAAAAITEAGFMPLIHPQCYARLGNSKLAGDAATRLAALHDVYANPQVKAILCARGGYGVVQYLAQLDLDLVARNPKPLVGMSDHTALLNLITQRTGHPVLLGPLAGNLERGKNIESFSQLWKLLKGEAVLPPTHPATAQARVLVAGEAEGVLLGGNLTLLANRMGTPHQLRPEGSILIIEDVGETLYKLDRMLMQLKDAGFFEQVRGLIIGEMVGCADETDGFKLDETLDGFLQRWFGDLTVPVITNFPCGHGQEHAVMPLGVPVRLRASAQGIEIAHKPLFV